MTHTTRETGHLQPQELNSFIDGELNAAEAQPIRQHLDGCHRCSLRVLSATQLKAATSRARDRFAPPPEALARLTAQLHPHSPQEAARTDPSRPALFRPIAAWSALAAAILIVAFFVGWRQIHRSDHLTAELLDQHLATISSGAVPEVISTDRHTVKPWFQGRLPFSFNLPDELPADTALQGADLVYLEGRPAALLIFSIHKHEASVFLTQRTGGIVLPPRSLRSGFTVRSAIAAELRLMAVSDVNPTELDALVNAVAKVQ